MKRSIFNKVFKVLSERPTQILAYVRQSYLFYQTYFLRKIVINNKPQYLIGKNVRLQALRSLMAGADSSICIGSHSIVYENALIHAFDRGQIVIGEGSIVGDARISSRKKIVIGEHFLTSWNVFIQDFDSHPTSAQLRMQQMKSMTANMFPHFEVRPDALDFDFDFPSEEIIIGNNVWVGANVTILKGVHIGDNCIVATGAVVLKGHYMANSIIAGNPAKVVKTLT